MYINPGPAYLQVDSLIVDYYYYQLNSFRIDSIEIDVALLVCDDLLLWLLTILNVNIKYLLLLSY